VVAYDNNAFLWNSIPLDIPNSTSTSTFCSNIINKNGIATSIDKDGMNIENNCDNNKECNDLIFNTCKNYNIYSQLKEIQTTHSGSDGRFVDSNSLKQHEIIKTVNLGIGIIILSVMIYNNVKLT
jgi:hypothetical protein